MTEDEIYEMLQSLENEEIECDDVPIHYWYNHQFCGIIINNDWDSYYYEYMPVLDEKDFWLKSLPNQLWDPDRRDDVAWKISSELWSDTQFAKDLLEIFPFWKKAVYDRLVKNGNIKPEENIYIPSNSEKFYFDGVEFRIQRNYEQALASYAEALKLTPNDAKIYSYRGEVYYYQKNYEAALKEYNKAIELGPTGQLPREGDYYFNRGILHDEHYKYDLALLDYQKALEINPDHPRAGDYISSVKDRIKKSGPTKPLSSTPPPLPSAKPWKNLPSVQYYAGLNDEQAGPFGWEELDGLVKKGELTDKTLVWKKGFADWIAVSDVEELKVLLK